METEEKYSVPPRVGFESPVRHHGHYYKNVAHLNEIDVYRVLGLFGVANPCAQHAIKKLLMAGQRGGGKDTVRDIQEAIDTLNRLLEIMEEDNLIEAA